MQERRVGRRGRTYLSAHITFHHLFAGTDCMVRNMSDAGARVEWSGEAFIPDEFGIIFPHKDQHIRAKLAWRTKTEAGIVFARADRGSLVSLRRAGIRAIEAAPNALA